MIKNIALFLGTACLSFNVFAYTAGDLNSALNNANQQAIQVQPKMIYGGKDLTDPKQAQTAVQPIVS